MRSEFVFNNLKTECCYLSLNSETIISTSHIIIIKYMKTLFERWDKAVLRARKTFGEGVLLLKPNKTRKGYMAGDQDRIDALCLSQAVKEELEISKWDIFRARLEAISRRSYSKKLNIKLIRRGQIQRNF